MMFKFLEKVRGPVPQSELDIAVKLISDTESFSQLIRTVSEYYRARNRSIFMVHYQEPREGRPYLVRFIADRRHAVEYYIDSDPRMGGFFGGLRLGIGPEYADPIIFWSHEDSRRFHSAATTSAIERNLALLDVFLKKHHQSG